MRICFLHVGFLNAGGIERAVSMLSNALCEEENVEIFSLGLIRPKENVYKLDERVTDSSLYDFKTTIASAILKYKAIQKTVKYIKMNNIDIVVGCGSPYFLLSVIAAKLCGIKSICWEHTNPKIVNEFRFQKQVRRFGLKLSDANVVITKKALSFYNLRRKRSNFLIYNPIDKALIKEKVIYNNASKKIISVGRLQKVKNYDLVVQLCKKLVKKFPEWSWDIYGDGGEKEHLQKLIDENEVSGFLTLKGNDPDIYNKYDKYSFIVMTSIYEGFPMVLLEASARGLPMVSFDVETGPSEIITEGENGYLIPDFDDVQLLKKIEELINDSDRREKMSKRAQEIAENFYMQEIVPQWMRVFEEVLYGNKRIFK